MKISIWKNERIGESLLRYGAIGQRKVKIILLRQECGDSRYFGEIAVALHYISENTLKTYLHIRELPLWQKEQVRYNEASHTFHTGIGEEKHA
jgi:hypothetical protein